MATCHLCGEHPPDIEIGDHLRVVHPPDDVGTDRLPGSIPNPARRTKRMIAGEQTFEGMDRITKFSFTGVKYESLNVDFERGQEVDFKLHGVVNLIGDKDMKNGPVHLVGVEVESVVPLSFEEPEDPAVKVADGDGLFDDEADERDRDGVDD